MGEGRNGDGALFTGGCLCGAVRFEVRTPLRPIVFCHCGQCRRFHGQFAAYTAAPGASLRVVAGTALRWYRASPRARRGFCGTCGSSLFWVPDAQPHWCIACGAFDCAPDLEASHHVFVDDRASFDRIDDDLPRFAGSATNGKPAT